ncbi:hypothetical protein [Pseudacidobacterium ailaaui]|jgi:hypothetical protein|uniref:hypothetical protein n=1 Tax=Pseudacidobacterium ailaaui TaxID=1382359 RepID=UPI000478E42B|nr:hypothetical protein [Pseudacidobacterium ailaaui]MBX6358966.1 hypothetical protein [Pseudacidobacterium ailaaui]MCL6464966.1 hypothetical protein [Pseudacidobacterium ailaaui]MDI3253807.1 hypothetical protein [Bacillota bacterium]
MARNLYILASTLLLFALISCGMVYVGNSQPGLPGNGSLWKTAAMFLALAGLIVALAGSLTAMFEQVDRRTEERKYQQRRRKPR